MKLKNVKKGMFLFEEDSGFCSDYEALEDARHVTTLDGKPWDGYECLVKWVGGDEPYWKEDDDTLVLRERENAGPYGLKLTCVA